MRIYSTALIAILMQVEAVKAEVIQVPEGCIHSESAPCLVRSTKQAALLSKNKDYSYLVDAKSITKWNSYQDEIKVEVLEGTLYIKKSEGFSKVFNINGVVLTSHSFFVSRDQQKLKILDGEKFVMSEYQLSSNAEVGSVVVKVDFVDKLNLIAFLSQFFHTKPQLMDYLKKNESKWSQEFAQQNKNQTKVLVRAIASVEDEERMNVLRKQKQEKELKRVRQEFFYRTFYR